MSDSTLIRYSAGPWLGMVRGDCLVALPADASEETAAIVWDLMAETPGVDRLLATILSGRLDLTGLPSFALVAFRGGEVHSILRGPVSLQVTLADGTEQTLRGTGVATWNERMLGGVTALRFAVDEDEFHSETLPLLQGAVRLSALEADLPDDGHAPSAQPAAEAVGGVSGGVGTRAPATAPLLVSEPAPPQRDPEPAPESETESAPAEEAESEAEAEPDSEPVLEPEPDVEPESAPEPVEVELEPAAEPETTPAPEAGDEAEIAEEPVEDSADSRESADEQADETSTLRDADTAVAPVDPEDEPAQDDRDDSDDSDDLDAPDGPGEVSAPEAQDDPDDEHTVISPAGQQAQQEASRTTVPGPQELIDSVPWLAAARQATQLDPAPGQTEDPDDAATQVPELLEMPADLGQTVRPDHDGSGDTSETGAGGENGAAPGEDADDQDADDQDTVLSVPAPAPAPSQDPDDADTVMSPGSASVPPAPSAPPASPAMPPGPQGSDGLDEADHDGHTVMKSDLGDLAGVGTAPEPPAAPAPAPPSTGPMVLARSCAQGHANPPTSTECAVCGQTLDGEAAQVRRPSLGRMRMSTGEVIELDRPVVIGRQPQAHRVGPGTMPRMIQVRSPHGDISRNHCEVVLEGWHVQLKDLKATNGTVLIREGRPPRRLGQGEQIMLLDGDIADLGDGVSARFEGLW